jgi:hypothetical protein
MLLKNKGKKKSKVAKTRLFLLVPLMFILAACAGLTNNLSNNNSNLTASSNTTLLNQNSSMVNLAKDEIKLVAIEVSKTPNRLTYTSNESISTLGGELRLSFSDYSVKYISMNDQMIDVKTLDTSRLGQSRINIIHKVNEIEAKTSYFVNIVAFTVQISKVELDLRKFEIVQNNSHQFHLTISPANAKFEKVEWASSNDLVATVDEKGFLKALNPGTTLITVRVDNFYTFTSEVIVLIEPILFKWANPTLVTVSFTTVGSTNWIVPEGVFEVEYLVVGGGGGAGNGFDSGAGGGGGGGMVIQGSLLVLHNQQFGVSVGDGGLGGGVTSNNVVYRTNRDGSIGQNSNFGGIIALGGGAGGGSRSARRSLGGIKSNPSSTPSTGGGGGGNATGGTAGNGRGGGGGGALSNGNDATAIPGVGGAGIQTNISNQLLEYGVGGSGGNNNGQLTGANGLNNRGFGGSGGSISPGVAHAAAGGKGGSGVVILKFYQFQLIRIDN